jgi:hypothetical protein
VAAGNEYHRFWRHTLREIDLILSGAVLRFEREAKLRRRSNYELGQLVLIAFNNPKKFPKPDDFFADASRRRVSSSAEIRAFFEAHGTQVPRSE